jgi:hypothetical protein
MEDDPVEAILCVSGRDPAPMDGMGEKSRRVFAALAATVERTPAPLLLLPECRERILAQLPASARLRIDCATYRSIRAETEALGRAELLLQLGQHTPESALPGLLGAVAAVALETSDAERQRSLLLELLRRIMGMKRPDAALPLLDGLVASSDRISSVEVRGWAVYAQAAALAHAGDQARLLPLVEKLYHADKSFPDWCAGGWGIGRQGEPLTALVLHLAECGFREQAERFVPGGLETWQYVFGIRPSPHLLARLLELALTAPSGVWHEDYGGKGRLARAILDLPRSQVPTGFRDWLHGLEREFADRGAKGDLAGLYLRILLAGGIGPGQDTVGQDQEHAASALLAILGGERVFARPGWLLAQLPGREGASVAAAQPIVEALLATGLKPPVALLVGGLESAAGEQGANSVAGCGMPDHLALLAWAHLGLSASGAPGDAARSAQVLEDCLRGMHDRWVRPDEGDFVRDLEKEVLRPLWNRGEQELVDRLLVALIDLRCTDWLDRKGLRTLLWRYGTSKAGKTCVEHLTARLDEVAGEYGITDPCGSYGEDWTNLHEELLDFAMELHLEDPTAALAGIRRATSALACRTSIPALKCKDPEPVVRLLEAEAVLGGKDCEHANGALRLDAPAVAELNPGCWAWMDDFDRQPGTPGREWWKRALERRFSGAVAREFDVDRIRYSVARYVWLAAAEKEHGSSSWVLDGFEAGIRLATDVSKAPEDRLQILVSLFEMVAAAEKPSGSGGAR